MVLVVGRRQEAHDKRISDHVLRVHRYRGSTLDESGGLVDDERAWSGQFALRGARGHEERAAFLDPGARGDVVGTDQDP